jgi:hypothetical protein
MVEGVSEGVRPEDGVLIVVEMAAAAPRCQRGEHGSAAPQVASPREYTSSTRDAFAHLSLSLPILLQRATACVRSTTRLS